MDDRTKDHIRKLCTEIGSIMEDASVVALVWNDSDHLTTAARVKRLHQAHAEIERLLNDVGALIP